MASLPQLSTCGLSECQLTTNELMMPAYQLSMLS